MCTNATKTAADLMAAIEPTLKAFLSYENVLNTPEGQAAIAAFDSALTAVQNWQTGTPATEVLEVISAFTSAFAAVSGPLNLPPAVLLLVNVIAGGIEAVIGVLQANSPAPVVASVAGDASPEDVQRAHQDQVLIATSAKIKQLVPTFKRSIWDSAAYQYKKTWNDTVTGAKLPQTLHVA